MQYVYFLNIPCLIKKTNCCEGEWSPEDGSKVIESKGKDHGAEPKDNSEEDGGEVRMRDIVSPKTG